MTTFKVTSVLYSSLYLLYTFASCKPYSVSMKLMTEGINEYMFFYPTLLNIGICSGYLQDVKVLIV